jgi:para-nitrobenzyl esterase
MQKEWLGVLLAPGLAVSCAAADERAQVNQVETLIGRLEGVVNAATGIRAFKGVPFAAPPVGALRWQAPQPPAKWEGVRPATNFGPRAMQPPIYGDMVFRSNGMSEDCLYLNVWTPARTADAKLPVLVYFFGGGYIAGDGSEGRYDGESMATNGLVAVTVNYRLGVFGFLAHPELTRESPHQASGNYGLLDQHAALQWVSRNIAAFGGDPRRVTIAGESAGSLSVCAQMASPLSKGLIAGAIGESGSVLATLAPTPLKQAEAAGAAFAEGLGLGAAPSLAALRAIPAERLLQAKVKPGDPWCKPTVDGYFFPKDPGALYAAGEQAHVPLLAGVNAEEAGCGAILGKGSATVEHYRKALQRLYADKADAVFKLYPAANDAEVADAARELASDRFISYGTWAWVDLATKTGGQPTYYYLFSRPRPGARHAVHSAEIEYALGNLGHNKAFAWTPDDRAVSQRMQAYFANFIKTGNPNGPALPEWPTFASGRRLVIDVNTRAENCDALRARYALFP